MTIISYWCMTPKHALLFEGELRLKEYEVENNLEVEWVNEDHFAVKLFQNQPQRIFKGDPTSNVQNICSQMRGTNYKWFWDSEKKHIYSKVFQEQRTLEVNRKYLGKKVYDTNWNYLGFFPE